MAKLAAGFRSRRTAQRLLALGVSSAPSSRAGSRSYRPAARTADIELRHACHRPIKKVEYGRRYIAMNTCRQLIFACCRHLSRSRAISVASWRTSDFPLLMTQKKMPSACSAAGPPLPCWRYLFPADAKNVAAASGVTENRLFITPHHARRLVVANELAYEQTRVETVTRHFWRFLLI